MTEGFTYPVDLRAIEKWKSNNLEELESPHGVKHFRFLFNGSTCNNGGTPFIAYLHTHIDAMGDEPRVKKAWIEIPDDQIDYAKEMCTFRNSGEKFLDSLADFPIFKDREISEILSQDDDLNHAGCFCTVPMTNQKWRMALSTIHFALCAEN